MSSALDLHRGSFTNKGLEKATVILRKNGEYKEVPVFRRGTKLYAKVASSYIALRSGSTTSSLKWFWAEIIGADYYVGGMSQLYMGKKVKVKLPTSK